MGGSPFSDDLNSILCFHYFFDVIVLILICNENGGNNVAYGTHIFGSITGVITAKRWKELVEDTDRELSELYGEMT
jgi:membrane associated rhomboid family serine protease